MSEFFRCLSIIPWIAKRSHTIMIILEPWGIMLAVAGLFYTAIEVNRDRNDRRQDLADRAMATISAAHPENSKKLAVSIAVERLHNLGHSLKGINLAGANLAHIDLRNADLDYADLRGTNLDQADLSGASLVNADLSEAVLLSTNLSHASLHGASLANARIHSADFLEADTSWTDFSGLSVYSVLAGRVTKDDGTLLEEVWLLPELNLAPDQLSDACGNEKTRTQLKAKIPSCSEVSWYDSVHGDR